MQQRSFFIIGIVFLYFISLFQFTQQVTLESSDLKSVIVEVQKLVTASSSDSFEFQTAYKNSIKELRLYAGLNTIVVKTAPATQSDEAPSLLVIKIKNSYLLPTQLELPVYSPHSTHNDSYHYNLNTHISPPPTPPPNFT